MKDKPAKPASSQQDRFYFVYAHHRFRRDTGSLDKYIRHGEDRSHWKPAERGGLTVCVIVDEADHVLGTGTAECSIKDAYNYRIGRLIASGRALKDAGLLDGIRRERKARRVATRQQTQGE